MTPRKEVLFQNEINLFIYLSHCVFDSRTTPLRKTWPNQRNTLSFAYLRRCCHLHEFLPNLRYLRCRFPYHRSVANDTNFRQIRQNGWYKANIYLHLSASMKIRQISKCNMNCCSVHVHDWSSRSRIMSQNQQPSNYLNNNDLLSKQWLRINSQII